MDDLIDDLIERLRNLPPREICEHGSQKVKCPHCENAALEQQLDERDAEIARLRAEVADVRAKLRRKLIKRADDARSFPANTCPASRHAHNIGYALARGETFAQLAEEPVDCGESILATVAALWEARTERDALRARIEGAPVARPLEVQCKGIDDPDRERLDRIIKSGKRVALVVVGDGE